MLVPATFATHFARAVELFRDPAAKEEQKVQFRALLALLKTGGVTVAPRESGLVVNGEAVPGPLYEAVGRSLEFRGVAEIVIAQDPPPSHLFELLRTLAGAAGTENVPAQLRDAGVDTIEVRLARAVPLDVGAEGILRGEAVAEMAGFDGPAARGPAPIPAQPEPAPLAPAGSADPLAVLERNPRVANAGDLLGALRRRIDEAMRLGRPEQALHLLAGIVRCEQLVPDGDQRRVYGTVLKRILTKPMLEALAQLVTVPAYGADAVSALQRAGATGVEVLLDLLVAAPTVAERQAVFGALAEMKEGTDQLVHLLGHGDWFVVRNVAELVGELVLEEAVPALAQQLDHEDERVRRAVALALAKIGNRAAAEPLRRALRDESPAVRMQAALGVGGRKASALAMPLVVAMEEEEDPEVERELVLALGRIGSSDAVQALIKFAQPAGRLFHRRPAGIRAAAVEALRVAATPAAVGMLQGLADDSDKQVRVAAQEALKDLKR